MSWTLEVEQPFGDERIIRCYVLHNGLRAILVADDSAPIFSYQTWLGVGSRDEQRGRSGMAHFFEHLMFGETEAVPRGEFDRLIEGRGGDNNAATWNEWTYYRTSLPASDLDLAARLESDRMRHLILEDQQIEIEREVVLSERKERIDDDLDGFLDETLCRLAFTEHPYGRPTIGWAEDIRGLSKPDIQAFYRTFYAPNNAVLVLCGDIDEENALAVLDRYYGDMEPAEITRAPLASEPEQRAERRLVVNRPVGADRIAMGYKVPGQSDSDWVVLELIAGVLSGAPSARAYRRLVVDTQMATAVECGVPPFRDPCLFRVTINLTRDHRAAEAIAEIDALFGELARQPVAQAELDKIKNCIETDFWSLVEDCDGVAEALGHYQICLGDFRQLFILAERLSQVTPADIQRVAATYLVPERRTVVICEPEPERAAGPGGDGAL